MVRRQKQKPKKSKIFLNRIKYHTKEKQAIFEYPEEDSTIKSKDV